MLSFNQYLVESSVHDKSDEWVKGYKSEQEALRTIRNIKDEVLHILSGLRQINREAVDAQDELQSISQLDFSKWVVNYFTDELKKANWPESHSDKLNSIIQDKVKKPLLAHKKIVWHL